MSVAPLVNLTPYVIAGAWGIIGISEWEMVRAAWQNGGEDVMNQIAYYVLNGHFRKTSTAVDGTKAGSAVKTELKQKKDNTRTKTKTKTGFMKLRHICRDRKGHRIPCSKKKMNQY